MASLGITNAELKANMGTVLSVSRDPGEWDVDTIADADRFIREGRRRLFDAHDWDFLKSEVTFVTEEPIYTGRAPHIATEPTITASNGVVAFNAGTVDGNPPDILTLPTATELINQWLLAPEDGGLYTITGMSQTASTSTITINDESLIAGVGVRDTFTLYKYRYAMPSDFAAWLDPIRIENRSKLSFLNEYHTIPDYTLNRVKREGTVRTGEPEDFAIAQIVNAETGTPSMFLEIYPLPIAAVASEHVLVGRYRRQPGDALLETGEVIHPIFASLLQESILSVVEIMHTGHPGIHTQQFQQMLPQAIKQDGFMKGTRRLPPRGFGHHQDALHCPHIRASTTWLDTL